MQAVIIALIGALTGSGVSAIVVACLQRKWSDLFLQWWQWGQLGLIVTLQNAVKDCENTINYILKKKKVYIP